MCHGHIFGDLSSLPQKKDKDSLEALVGIFLLVKIESTLSNAIKWTSSILLNGGFSLIYLVRIFNQMQSAQKLGEKD